MSTHQRDARRGFGRSYVGLPEQEAFDIEYWLLEEAKLQRMPKPKSLARPRCLVTAAPAHRPRIASKPAVRGRLAWCWRYRPEGAGGDAGKFRQELQCRPGPFRAMDVTDENAVASRFAHAAAEYGGLDILISNAGISSAARSRDRSRGWTATWTSWARVFPGVTRSLRLEGETAEAGGSIVFIASKTASPLVNAWPSAPPRPPRSIGRCSRWKAPITASASTWSPPRRPAGSGIWSSEWRARAPPPTRCSRRAGRALPQAVHAEALGLSGGCGEATYFLASDLAAKSTGNIINVDAGNAVVIHALDQPAHGSGRVR